MWPHRGSPPDSSIPGILQARILEWVAISFSNACMHAKSLQLCPTLCNPMDLASYFYVAVAVQPLFTFVLCASLKCSIAKSCPTPLQLHGLYVACQAPLSMGFSSQEYWSRLPFPSPMHACMLSRLSHVRLSATPWTAAHQAPLPTGFSREEYWSGLPFPSPKGNLIICF